VTWRKLRHAEATINTQQSFIVIAVVYDLAFSNKLFMEYGILKKEHTLRQRL